MYCYWSQEAVRSALDKVCMLLPGYITGECRTFVDQNAIEIMELLDAGIVPGQVCRVLLLCKEKMGEGEGGGQVCLAEQASPPQVLVDGAVLRRVLRTTNIMTYSSVYWQNVFSVIFHMYQ